MSQFDPTLGPPAQFVDLWSSTATATVTTLSSSGAPQTTATWERGGTVESSDAVERHAQADVELVAEVVARLQYVLAGELDEVRVLVGGHLGEDRFGKLWHVVGAVEG